MPPWNPPSDYCAQMYPASHTTGWPSPAKLYGSGDSASWTSDNVFCMPGAADFWQTCLWIALIFWGFFTVVQLFVFFDIHHGHGHAMARTVKHMFGQIILLFLACGSFFMMLIVHQLVWLIEDAIVGGGLDRWRVDGIWIGSAGHPGASGVMAFTQLAMGIPSFWAWASGGNDPGEPSIFTSTLPQIFFGLGSVQDTLLQATGSVRFVMMLLLVGSAPLAIISSGFDQLRSVVFRRWLELWLELEGLAIVTALGVSAFAHAACGQANLDSCLTPDRIQQFLNTLAASLGQNADITILFPNLKGIGHMQLVFLMLGFITIICGLQLAYIWNFLGNLITLGTGMYQASYNRVVAQVKAGENAVAGALEVGGLVVSALGAPEFGLPVMAAGAALKTVGDTAMSAIPQANGYGGGTMSELPAFSAEMAGGGGPGGGDISGGDGGGDVGGGAGAAGGAIAGAQPPPGRTMTTQIKWSTKGVSVVGTRFSNTARGGAPSALPPPESASEAGPTIVDSTIAP